MICNNPYGNFFLIQRIDIIRKIIIVITGIGKFLVSLCVQVKSARSQRLPWRKALFVLIAITHLPILLQSGCTSSDILVPPQRERCWSI